MYHFVQGKCKMFSCLGSLDMEISPVCVPFKSSGRFAIMANCYDFVKLVALQAIEFFFCMEYKKLFNIFFVIFFLKVG